MGIKLEKWWKDWMFKSGYVCGIEDEGMFVEASHYM